jgi:flagellar basal-body rod modification protein FlgD
MAVSGVTTNVTSAITGNGAGTSSSVTLADNFQTFLTLLTTQLKNQNPLDPLDTNQFTQQLVQFAQVEQQLKSNDQLATLISVQQSMQTTQALGYVGHIVAIEGKTTTLANGSAGWSFNATKPASATISIANAAGSTVYSGTFALQAGAQNFIWDGKDASGNTVPDGEYTISITATDAAGSTVAVSTEIQGVVDSVDVSQIPPMLNVNGTDYTLDKIKRVVRYVAPGDTAPGSDGADGSSSDNAAPGS